MNIPPPQAPKTSTPSVVIQNSFDLKLNQQVDVKVLSTTPTTQTILLQLSKQTNQLPSNTEIQVQSDQKIDVKPGQPLKLLVSQITPAIEFKILIQTPTPPPPNSKTAQRSTEKQKDHQGITLKLTSPKLDLQKTSNDKKPSHPVTTVIVKAKIISIDKNEIQLKLDTTSSSGKTENGNKSQHQIITLNKQQIIPLLPTLNNQRSTKAELKQTDTLQNFPKYQPGQNIKLEIKQQGIDTEYKIIDTPRNKLVTGQIVTAKIIDIKNNKVRLQLTNPPTHHTAKDTPLINASPVITLNKNQLSYPALDQRTLPEAKTPTFTDQPLVKNSLTLEHKINQLPTKLSTSHALAAKTQSSAHNSVRSDDNKFNSLAILTPKEKTLVKGQTIKLEVTKMGIRPEFKIITNKSIPDADTKENILKTIKHALPIQETPSELVNQLIKNLPAINNNESIPDNLKRLAKEILDSLPRIKSETSNPKQLKQSTLHSGLFLEAKLSQTTEKKGFNFQSDFKNQLMKFHHILKQEIELKNHQTIQENEIDLIKEMQQKTESALAKIILNQLGSLPKEEGIRQTWIFDLPFLNKEFCDSVKIEIDREQQKNEDSKQKNWALTLTITPPELGTIYCKASYFDGSINTRFWCENNTITEKITQNLDYLKTKFEKAGIKTGHMTAQTGAPTQDAHQKISNQNLFDQQV